MKKKTLNFMGAQIQIMWVKSATTVYISIYNYFMAFIYGGEEVI